MKKANSIFWGLALVAVGVFLGLNAFGITDINIFFDGWWTLFIIVPCTIGLFTDYDKTGNLIGILIGLVQKAMSHLKANPFFTTLTSAFFMALAAYSMVNLGIAKHTDGVIIGALMILVPGLLFTNAMRDIIFGDTNSGINRIVQVLSLIHI